MGPGAGGWGREFLKFPAGEQQSWGCEPGVWAPGPGLFPRHCVILSQPASWKQGPSRSLPRLCGPLISIGCFCGPAAPLGMFPTGAQGHLGRRMPVALSESEKLRVT